MSTAIVAGASILSGSIYGGQARMVRRVPTMEARECGTMRGMRDSVDSGTMSKCDGCGPSGCKGACPFPGLNLYPEKREKPAALKLDRQPHSDVADMTPGAFLRDNDR